MTNEELLDLKSRVARKLVELQCELAEYQSRFCAYDQGDEIRSTILAIDVLLLKFIEFDCD